MEKKTSSCPLNCWDNCGLTVTVGWGKVINVEGDQDHPVTKGKICGRGRMLAERANSDKRILYPLKKTGGTFTRISWGQALDEIASRLSAIKKEYGTTAVLHSHDYANNGLLKNLDYRFFNGFGGVTELEGSLCWGAGIEAQKRDFGNAYSHSPEDLFNSKTAVIWGRNPARTNLHLLMNLKKAKKQGVRVIVIDPLKNETASAIADRYISVKPGMDGVLALGILKEMLRLGLEDRSFIQDYSTGFESIERLLADTRLSELAAAAEVEEAVFTELARVYADRPVATYLGLGMQRYTNGGNTIRTIDALAAASGNVGIAGGGANFGGLGVGESFDLFSLTRADLKKERRVFSRISQAEQILEAAEPPVKMAVVSRSNPLAQLPDTNLSETAFSQIETVVVMDKYMTDSAELADYVLPVAGVFEEEDIYYASMYHSFANYGPKLAEPPGEAKSDLWIWTELANRLGFGDLFSYSIDEFLEMGLGKLAENGITLEAFKTNKRLKLPVDNIPWKDHKFKTPSGKYEFASLRGSNKEIKVDYPFESEQNQPELARRYPYSLLTIHPLRSNHSQHYPLIEGIQRVKVEVSEDIAEERRLQPGEQVRVYNSRGSISGTVAVLKGGHRRTINIDEGQWKKFGGSVNALTSSRLSDNGMGSTFYDCLVQIEKWAENDFFENRQHIPFRYREDK